MKSHNWQTERKKSERNLVFHSPSLYHYKLEPLAAPINSRSMEAKYEDYKEWYTNKL